MTRQPFRADVNHQPELAMIELHGEINSFAESYLYAAYEAAESTDPAIILLNFEDVEYINSTGIALLVGLLTKARKSRRRLVVSNLSDHYVEIFQITRLADFMTIYPDLETALSEV